MNSVIGEINFQQKIIDLRQSSFYYISVSFVFFSVITPYLCHLVLLSGRAVLPLYFFVLIAGYKYGWRMGVITALFSPMISYMLSGMPSGQVLVLVVLKGAFLGLVAGVISLKSKKLLLRNLFIIITSYLLFGLVVELVISGQARLFISDLTIGYPGLIIQLFGGYYGLKLINKYL